MCIHHWAMTELFNCIDFVFEKNNYNNLFVLMYYYHLVKPVLTVSVCANK